MPSDTSLEGVIDDNLEGAVSGTEYGIIHGPDGEVIGSTHGSADMIKLGRWDQNWEKKLEIREFPLMGSQEGMVMANLRDTDWRIHWEH